MDGISVWQWDSFNRLGFLLDDIIDGLLQVQPWRKDVVTQELT